MRPRTWKLVRLVAPIGLIPLFACLAPPVESPKTTVTQETSVRVEQSVKNKVDILFMVDNSLSMAPKQKALPSALPAAHQAARRLRGAGQPGVVSHRRRHVGPRRRPCNTANCKPGGDGGKLQVMPNPNATYPAPTNCSGFSLTGGVNFLDYNQLTGTNNIGGGLMIAGRVQLHGVGRRRGLRLRAPARVAVSRAARQDRQRTPASCAPTRSSRSSSSPTRMTARRRTTPISSTTARRRPACTACCTRSAARSSACSATACRSRRCRSRASPAAPRTTSVRHRPAS